MHSACRGCDHWTCVNAEFERVGSWNIEQGILSYLAKHPDAGDTVEGIVQWWLLEQRIERQVAETQNELHKLVCQGLVHEFNDASDRVHYRVNPTRQTEIRRILNL